MFRCAGISNNEGGNEKTVSGSNCQTAVNWYDNKNEWGKTIVFIRLVARTHLGSHCAIGMTTKTSGEKRWFLSDWLSVPILAVIVPLRGQVEGSLKIERAVP